MHGPDGFLDGPTSVGTIAIAATGVGIALWRSRSTLDDRTAPMAGMAAVFVFAAQMLNFPVGAGTSGHLLGGALAAVLVGPWTATLCITVVVMVQALLFADGGITALGTNVTLLAIVGVWVGWAAFRGASLVLPRRTGSVPLAAAVGAFVSVPVTALAFVGLYAVGGQAPIPLDTLTTAMLTWHVGIGLGEAVITFLVIASISSTRPDLVAGAAGRRPADLTQRPTEVAA